MAGTPAVRLDQVVVRISLLRIFVEVLHVGMGWCAIQVEVVLLYIFAVIPFAVRQPEETLLENGVLAVPEREGEAKPLLVVRDPGQTVLTPAVGTRTRLVMAEVVPGVTIVTVVFANRPPLSLAKVGSPFFPRDTGLLCVL
jgi:hypothetical protein